MSIIGSKKEITIDKLRRYLIFGASIVNAQETIHLQGGNNKKKYQQGIEERPDRCKNVADLFAAGRHPAQKFNPFRRYRHDSNLLKPGTCPVHCLPYLSKLRPAGFYGLFKGLMI